MIGWLVLLLFRRGEHDLGPDPAVVESWRRQESDTRVWDLNYQQITKGVAR